MASNEGGVFSTAVTAITGLLAVIFGFFYRTKKQNLDHITKSWEELIEDNTNFRDEVRKDLQNVKQERDQLVLKLHMIDLKLTEVTEENLVLKKHEIELAHELESLKEENVTLKGQIDEQEKQILSLNNRINNEAQRIE